MLHTYVLGISEQQKQLELIQTFAQSARVLLLPKKPIGQGEEKRLLKHKSRSTIQ